MTSALRGRKGGAQIADEIGQGGGGCLANLDIIFKMVYHHISAQYPRSLHDNV